ncbi:MAG: hypothetical protein GXO36_06810 [Chloroflexi bacterium]|nr:hypothetical protein [Chloroflexota bacterium]
MNVDALYVLLGGLIMLEGLFLPQGLRWIFRRLGRPAPRLLPPRAIQAKFVLLGLSGVLRGGVFLWGWPRACLWLAVGLIGAAIYLGWRGLHQWLQDLARLAAEEGTAPEQALDEGGWPHDV